MANESQKNDTQGASQNALTADVHHEHVAPILGVLVIVLILILGGLYLWGSMLSKDASMAPTERTIPNNEPETPRAEADRDILMTTSASAEIDAIYADLESTNLNDLDAELNTIDTEMNAALR
jgi:hypothetical protein